MKNEVYENGFLFFSPRWKWLCVTWGQTEHNNQIAWRHPHPILKFCYVFLPSHRQGTTQVVNGIRDSQKRIILSWYWRKKNTISRTCDGMTYIKKWKIEGSRVKGVYRKWFHLYAFKRHVSSSFIIAIRIISW